MARLRRKAATRPVGFNLLPEKFTLPQLQSLYEAIYQTQLDKRNFRKKLNAMDILEKLDEKDKKGSKRGAFYYMFNKEKLRSSAGTGILFFLIGKDIECFFISMQMELQFHAYETEIPRQGE